MSELPEMPEALVPGCDSTGRPAALEFEGAHPFLPVSPVTCLTIGTAQRGAHGMWITSYLQLFPKGLSVRQNFRRQPTIDEDAKDWRF
jgi:hypothetical protein